MKLAFLFPGQGSQKVGMGAGLARDFAVARRVFEEADDALGFNLQRLCFNGPEEQLRLTANTQPAILTVSVAALRVFETECGVVPDLAAGHSLGEYGALVAARSLAFGDAVRAVRDRGRLMQEACPPGQGAMAALIGLDRPAVQSLCDEVSSGGQIAVAANLNAPDQIVISGHAEPVRKALAIARDRGARASTELNVSAPFHSPLMAAAREAMGPVLGSVSFDDLHFGVIANVTAQTNRAGDTARRLLLEQITGPVRWEESMRALSGAGITTAIELGPGRVLSGLMRRIDRNIKVHSSEEPAALQTAIAAIAGDA
jgi:[acyl-carrier-protein] S-malonyltransferase